MTEILDVYQPQPEPLLIVVSGPSGAGKDVVLKRMQQRGYPFHFVVTTTDRPPRADERHGQDYFFVSTQEFERMIRADELLEHAVVYGQRKGISKAQVRQALASGHDVVMRLDVQGAATIRRLAPEAVLIFLSCESEEALVARLRARGTETEESLRARLAVVAEEMKQLMKFDYLIINHTGHLDEAVETIAAIIRAEKCRVHQRSIRL
jgi:guanylate kinase